MGALIAMGAAAIGSITAGGVAAAASIASVGLSAAQAYKANKADKGGSKTSLGPSGVGRTEKEDEVSLGAGKNKRARKSSRKQLMAPQAASGDTASANGPKKVGSGLNV